tara:strand:+ start:207 stop:602 length:396 start_codon:yes stop_codon:yes gene_type:complete
MFYLYILLIIYYTLGVGNFIYIAKFKTKYKNKTIRCVPTINKRKNKINNYRLDIPLLGNNSNSNSNSNSNNNSNSSLNKSSEDLSVNSDNYDNGQDPNKILELKEKRVSFNNNINQNLNNLEDESLENHFY